MVFQKGQRPETSLFSKTQVLLMRKLRTQGQTFAAIAQTMGCGRVNAKNAVRGITYADIPGAIPAGDFPRSSGQGHLRPNAKLSQNDAARVRQLSNEGMRHTKIALTCGVQTKTITDIVRGKTYRNAGGPICEKYHYISLAGSNHSRAILKEDQVAEIKGHLLLRVRIRRIATQFGISYDVVDAIKRGRSWRHIQAAIDVPVIPLFIRKPKDTVPPRLRGVRAEKRRQEAVRRLKRSVTTGKGI